MATCKECLHFQVCESFCGGIPRIMMLGNNADRDCGYFKQNLVVEGSNISKKHVDSLIESACRVMDLKPTEPAKWRRVVYTNSSDRSLVRSGYICSACGHTVTRPYSICSGCDSTMHGVDNEKYFKVNK